MSPDNNSGKNIEVIKSPDTERANRIPPGQIITEKWPVLHYGSIPRTEASRWTFTISGLVEKQRQLSYAEFIALPQVKVFSDIHCVTTWSKLNNLWEGVSTDAIRQVSRLLPEARFVTVHAFGGFTTNLSVDDFFESDVLFALKYNNKPLPLEHGYPVRLIVPRLYFWKSAKWVTGVQFTKEDIPGFWELHGYHNHGDPWQEERYS
ncbi:MAG: sulfite oxidase-like oxidoreductase [Chloroflexi bacterium]|nr:sulfite oxidase-like oxidoreductase [Chloroflexota bacterium]